MTTQIHAIVDALGDPVAPSLAQGRAPGPGQAGPPLENLEPEALLADKAYDADALTALPDRRQILPVIPSKADRPIQRKTDFAPWGERNPVERPFDTLEGFRAIAPRHDKLASPFLAAVQLVAASAWLN